MRIWNEMMIREHPRGAGPLVGRQLRYLIGSEHGWLGGMGLGAAALQVRERDRWIGWDVKTRRAHLDRIVGLSRFLIRPCVRCRNLASVVLSLCVRQFSDDFEARYGFRPWLMESFVDTRCFSGTCFRAANWVRVGRTQGRGRQDRNRQKAETVKDIYIYPIERDFRCKIGLSPDSGLGPLDVSEGVENENWAEKEFSGAPLGDRRLSRRLVECAKGKAQKPGRAFTGVFKGDGAAVKGYYRLIDKPDHSAVTMENILSSHREQTVRRMKAQRTVLCIQDGTDLDYTNLSECEGLGFIGTNQTGAKSGGLHLHSTLAATTDGLVLGVLRSKCLAPKLKSKKDARPPMMIPIEEKKTFRWIEGVRDCVGLAGEMPGTKLICVMDREADIFELFHEHRQNPCLELLVRAKYNRCTTGKEKLFDAVKKTKVRTRFLLHVSRQSARPKRSKQKARPKRAERTAEVCVRYKRVELEPARYNNDKDPIAVWVIHLFEEKVPSGVKPIEWFLLTTVKISSVQDAERCLGWYCLRWRIEDWHRVLKSGCRVEDLAHETANRLRRSIAIYMVVAWRIMLMTLMGRETPELPAEVLFSDLEIEVLTAFAKKRKLKPPNDLGNAVLLVGRLGGHLGRSRDPPPGHQLMWYGYVDLQLMCEGYRLGKG
jgi:hypothetical protein